jgi:hypothetical protein
MSLRESIANWLMRGEHTAQMRALAQGIAVLSETNYELERAREDASWTRLAGGAEQVAYDRYRVVPYARWMFQVGCPLTKGAVWNKTGFCFQAGIDGPAGPKSAGVDILRSFWTERSNQAAMFSTIRQYERSNQLLLDGDLFLSLHEGADSMLLVRRFAPLRVRTIIVDPDDPGRPLYYAYERQGMTLNVAQGTQAYDGGVDIRYAADWQNDDPALDPYYGAIPPEKLMPWRMMHVPLNRVADSGFGVCDVAASLPWFQASKRIAEDQATVSKATAVFMSQLTVAGNASQIEAFASRFADQVGAATEERTANGNGYGPVSAMPPGVELNINRAGSQAGDAWQNSRMMRVAGVAGMSQALHYLGDPENANLATARTMEAPVQVGFTVYQALQKDILRNQCDAQLRMHGIDPETVDYDIPVPAIIQPDAAEMAAQIMDAADGGYLTDDGASQRLLNLFGSDDQYQELEEIRKQREQRDGDRAAASAQALEHIDEWAAQQNAQQAQVEEQVAEEVGQ